MTKEIYVRAEQWLYSGLSNLSPEYFISSDLMNERETRAACATVLYVYAPSAWQMAVGSVTTKKSKQPELPVVHAPLPHISFIFFNPWWNCIRKTQ